MTTMTRRWIRPGPGDFNEYTGGDDSGTSYVNAYRGLRSANIDWSADNVEYVLCDVHRINGSPTAYDQHQVNMGTGSRTPTKKKVFRGDASKLEPSAKDGVVHGGHTPPSGVWTQQSGDTWQMTLTTYTPSVPIRNGVLLETTDDGLTCTLIPRLGGIPTSRGWWAATGQAGDTLYVNLGRTFVPNDVVLPYLGHYLNLANTQDMIFYAMSYYPTNRAYANNWKDKNGLGFIKVIWEFGALSTFPLFEIDGKHDDFRFDRSNFGWASEGLFYVTVDGFEALDRDDSTNFALTRSYWHDVGEVFGRADVDAHSIGQQNGDYNMIKYNRSIRSGPSYVMFCVQGTENPARMSRIIAKHNLVEEATTQGGITPAKAYEWDMQGGSPTGSADMSGCLIFGNIADDVSGSSDINGILFKAGTDFEPNLCPVERNIGLNGNIGYFVQNVDGDYNRVTDNYFEGIRRLFVNHRKLDNPSGQFYDRNIYKGPNPSQAEFLRSGAVQTFDQWKNFTPGRWDPASDRIP